MNDFSGHEAEMKFLASEESKAMASQEYLDAMRDDLAEERARLQSGFAREEDIFGGIFDLSEEGWTEARNGRIAQLVAAIARHPLA